MDRMPRDEIERLTPYDDVNAVLAELTDGIVRILDDELLGLYLTGSLTYGGFRRGSSDIDFLVVLGCPLEHDVRTSLEGVHARIASTYPAWSDRVEGSYITADMLDSIEPPVMPRPYINGGAFWEPDPRYGNEWLINLYALRECGVALAGPRPASLVPVVTIEDVREASRRDLYEEWLPRIDEPGFFSSSHIQAYVTLTLCRILHRAEHDGVVSKRVAAQWVREMTGARWVVDLIERAERWQHGQELNAADEVRRFIAYTRDRIAAGSS